MKLFLYLLIFLYIQLPLNVRAQIFTKKQVVADSEVLWEALEKHHPNLYEYADAATWKKFRANWEENLPDKLSAAEAYFHISQFGQVLQDGHTLFSPKEVPNTYLPVRLYAVDQKVYLEELYADIPGLENGLEIRTINGRSIDEIRSEMLDRLPQDGPNPAYSSWIFDTYFRQYYAYLYGETPSYELTGVDDTGKAQTWVLPALSANRIETFRTQHYTKDPVYDRECGGGLQLAFLPDSATAILTIRDFHPPILQKQYQQRFPKTIDTFFEEIDQSACNHLIIDLRHNQGGAIRYGQQLLSYLMEEPFIIVDSYQKVKGSAPDLRTIRGPGDRPHSPQSNRFRDKVTVLINGGTFSNSAIVCSILQEYQRATFMGTNYGGSHAVLAGGDKSISLPNSGIQVNIPTLRFNLARTVDPEIPGLLLDAYVKPTIEQRLLQQDPVLNRAIGDIR
ncbi:MAG: S41 family peptidase [Bacteroidota bacterium]